MKRSKLLMAGGTLILAVAAIFATKANKKFTSISTAKIGSSGFVVYGSSNFLTNNSSSKQAQLMLYTGSHSVLSGVEGALTTDVASSGNIPAYYR